MEKLGKDKTHLQKTMAFEKWLKGAMASEGVRQVDLAEELGMTRQTFIYHMKNHVPFDFAQLVTIFTYFDVDQEKIAHLMKTNK